MAKPENVIITLTIEITQAQARLIDTEFDVPRALENAALRRLGQMVETSARRNRDTVEAPF
jgi:hypothetical protein